MDENSVIDMGVNRLNEFYGEGKLNIYSVRQW